MENGEHGPCRYVLMMYSMATLNNQRVIIMDIYWHMDIINVYYLTDDDGDDGINADITLDGCDIGEYSMGK